jgi:hypothetical protein
MKLEDLKLKDSGVIEGKYGSSILIPKITVNELGLIVSVEEVPVNSDEQAQ